MSFWTQLLALLAVLFLLWYLFRTIKTQPEAFSKANFSKSFFTMGVLGLVLIVFVGFCVVLLRMS